MIFLTPCQIHHVFSDKTGTLTENIMVFKMASIAGAQYNVDMTHDLDPRKVPRLFAFPPVVPWC